MADPTLPGGAIAGSVEVREEGAGERLAGPGTGRVTTAPDARAERTASFDVEDFPVPTGREEDWRFTPLDRLDPLLAGEPSDAHLELTSDLPAGVEVARVATEEARRLGLPAPVDRLSSLAVAHSGGALVVTVPKGTELDEPIVLRLSGSDATAVVWGHVVLDVGALSRATIVLEHSGSARYAEAVSVLVGDGAQLELVSLQDWADDTVHAAHTATRLGRDARLRSVQVSLGGDLVRSVETVEYDGPGGDAELMGLFFADAGQHLEHRLFVDHAMPHCRSRVTYKGALQGADAHTVWIGDVLIRAAAEGTDTYELNRNLVLTDGARADSVPNLEIETGEIIGAGHASATGRFDDEQLFYLQSRGIPAPEARRLVVLGFFTELITRIGLPDLERRLVSAVERELARGAA